jgi:hypothetical protein
MFGAMPSAPTRRLEWIVRLVLYPAAIALIALWWHQHHAAQRAEAAADGVKLAGRTSQGERMTGWLVAGTPDRFELRIRYRCPPGGGKRDYVWTDAHTVGSGQDRVAGDRVLTGVDDYTLQERLNPGWTGTYTIHTDGRYTADTWRGTLTAVTTYTYQPDPRGVTAAVRTPTALACRSGPVRFALTRPGRR